MMLAGWRSDDMVQVCFSGGWASHGLGGVDRSVGSTDVRVPCKQASDRLRLFSCRLPEELAWAR
jgi:hypothetical protein